MSILFSALGTHYHLGEFRTYANQEASAVNMKKVASLRKKACNSHVLLINMGRFHGLKIGYLPKLFGPPATTGVDAAMIATAGTL